MDRGWPRTRCGSHFFLGQTIGGMIAEGVSGRTTGAPAAGTDEGAAAEPVPGENGSEPNYLIDPIVLDPIDLGPDFSAYLMIPGELDSAYYAAGGDPFQRRAALKPSVIAELGYDQTGSVSAEIERQVEYRQIWDGGELEVARLGLEADITRTGIKPGDEILRDNFKQQAARIAEVDQRVSAQLWQDLKDAASIYYDVGTTIIAPLGALDTGYRALTGQLTLADVATLGRGKVVRALDKIPLQGGVAHEAERLAQLGIPKNNVVWRPNQADMDSAAFKVIVGKPKFTAGGLPKGTIFDGTLGGNLEIKGGSSALNSSYQLRLQTYRSLKTNTPLTIETTRPVNPAFQQWLDRWGVSVVGPK